MSRMGRSAAMFDEGQLNHRQKEAALSLSGRERTAWLSAAIPQIADKDAFCAAVGENIALFADAEEWAHIIAADLPPSMTSAARQAIKDAGKEFLSNRRRRIAIKSNGQKMEWKEFCEIIAAATGKKGRALFLPLRAALTGKTEGPGDASSFSAHHPRQSPSPTASRRQFIILQLIAGERAGIFFPACFISIKGGI